LVQLGEELAPDSEPGSILFPQAQTPPTRAGAGIFLGQVSPPRAGSENPKDPFQNKPIVRPRSAFAGTLGEQRFDVGPLFVGQKYISHPQLVAYQKAKSAPKIKKTFEPDL